MDSIWVLKSHCEQLYMYSILALTRFTGRGTVGRNGILIVVVFEAIFRTPRNVLDGRSKNI